MRRKYESDEKTGVTVEAKRGKGKAKAQACTPDGYSGIESVSSVQYQTAVPNYQEGSQQSPVQQGVVGEYPTLAAITLDVYEVRADSLVMLNYGWQLLLL